MLPLKDKCGLVWLTAVKVQTVSLLSPRLLSFAITTKQIFVIYGDIKSYWLFTVLFVAPEMAPTVRNGRMNELRGFQVLS